MRNIPRHIAVLSALAIGAGTVGTGVAFASAPTAPTTVNAPETATDSGPNVQQGEQTSPDVPGAPAESTGSEAADSAGDTGPNVQEGDQSAPDVAGPADTRAATHAVSVRLTAKTVTVKSAARAQASIGA